MDPTDSWTGTERTYKRYPRCLAWRDRLFIFHGRDIKYQRHVLPQPASQPLLCSGWGRVATDVAPWLASLSQVRAVTCATPFRHNECCAGTILNTCPTSRIRQDAIATRSSRLHATGTARGWPRRSRRCCPGAVPSPGCSPTSMQRSSGEPGNCSSASPLPLL